MATSGMKHFIDKYEMVKRHSYQLEVTSEEQEELNLRMAVPYKNMKRTRFAKSALKKMNAVLKRDHKQVCRFISVSQPSQTGLVKTHKSSTQYTEALISQQIGEKVPGTSSKRPATDNMDPERPKKKQRTSESESSKYDITIQITRIEQITNAFQMLNSLSRRYNGPDGYITPPPELKLYNRKMDSEKAERDNTIFRQMQFGRLPPRNLRDMYLQKLLIKSSHTILNWKTPTVRSRPCLPQKERRPARYGAPQRNARSFVLDIVQSHMSANDASILNPLIVRASHGHIEALASNIESYLWSIDMEVKHYCSDRTYTQPEIEDCRPQVRNYDELDIKQQLAEKRKWSAWRFAKTAADVAEDAMRLKIDIANVIRGIEGRCGPTDCLLPTGATPLKALPLHMRSNGKGRRRPCKVVKEVEDNEETKETNKGKETKETEETKETKETKEIKAIDTIGGLGDIVPRKSFSLELYARSIGRSKLSNIVASAEDIEDIELDVGGRACKIPSKSASTDRASKKHRLETDYMG